MNKRGVNFDCEIRKVRGENKVYFKVFKVDMIGKRERRWYREDI